MSDYDRILNPIPKFAKRAIDFVSEIEGIDGSLISFEDSELGCGHYGCVVGLIDDPDTVVKITTDPSEAAFVEAALMMDCFPQGIVEYRSIIETDFRYRKRKVYAIWRQRAESVGLTYEHMRIGSNYERYSRLKFSDNLAIFNHFSNIFRSSLIRIVKSKDPYDIFDSSFFDMVDMFSTRIGFIDDDFNYMDRSVKIYKSKERMAASLSVCKNCAEYMRNAYMSDQVGEALSFYLDKGILLADVHGGNVGIIKGREDEGYYDDDRTWSITDPGHAIFLTPKYGDDIFPLPK